MTQEIRDYPRSTTAQTICQGIELRWFHYWQRSPKTFSFKIFGELFANLIIVVYLYTTNSHAKSFDLFEVSLDRPCSVV